eukprot:scaffold168925_cov52-Attheya_sp.AAC.1
MTKRFAVGDRFSSLGFHASLFSAGAPECYLSRNVQGSYRQSTTTDTVIGKRMLPSGGERLCLLPVTGTMRMALLMLVPGTVGYIVLLSHERHFPAKFCLGRAKTARFSAIFVIDDSRNQKSGARGSQVP